MKNATFTLRVAEALAKDVGRAVARLDPQDMTKIGVGVGDIVQIKGKKQTVAKAMPSYPEDRGKEIIQIDGITRENAQAGLGEKVQIEKIGFENASTVVLAPMTSSKAFISEKDRKYLGRLLEGLPVT
ncbi:MAG: AAA family ATPase, partial [Chloroflexi bacterium]|nr:AAA family ATPase [Chloroflexota bacterium]